jgi:hypothetical protein
MTEDVLEAATEPDATAGEAERFDLPGFCLPCGRRLATQDPYVADRNQARHAAPDRPRVYPAVVAGVPWWAVVVVVAVGLVAAAAWAVG